MHRSENGPLPSREQAEHRRAFFSDLTGAGSQLHRLPLVDGPPYLVSTPPGVQPAEVTPERQESGPQPPWTLARRQPRKPRHSAPEPIYEGQPAAGRFVGRTSAGRAVGQRAPSSGVRAGGALGAPVEMACATARSPADQDRWVPGKAGRRARAFSPPNPVHRAALLLRPAVADVRESQAATIAAAVVSLSERLAWCLLSFSLSCKSASHPRELLTGCVSSNSRRIVLC